VPPGGTQRDQAPPRPQAGHAAQIVSLEDIRRAEEIISALAGRRGLSPGGRADPAAQLLAALCADVDAGLGLDIGTAACAGPRSATGFGSEGRAVPSLALAAASAKWNRDAPPDDVAGSGSPRRVPRLRRVRAPGLTGAGAASGRTSRAPGLTGAGAASGRLSHAGRKAPVRALAAGLAAAAAVVTIAVLARPAGSHDATAPLAGPLQPAGRSETVTSAGHHGGPLAGPPKGTSGLIPRAPGLSSPGQRARGVSGGPAVSPGAAGSTAKPRPAVGPSGGGTQRSAGTANPDASQPAAEAHTGVAGRDPVTRAGAATARSGSVSRIPAGQPTVTSPAAASRAAASRPGAARSRASRVAPDAGRPRHSKPARRTEPQPWQFWLAGPGHAPRHSTARP
jgi:hypothetical protein